MLFDISGKLYLVIFTVCMMAIGFMVLALLFANCKLVLEEIALWVERVGKSGSYIDVLFKKY